MNLRFILLAFIPLVASPVWAINKCIGSDGKAVFQDAPCVGKGEQLDVRPASGRAPSTPATTPAGQPGAAVPAAAGVPKEGVFGESWQRRTFLENRGIADARGAIQAHDAQCEAKQAELASKKTRARNNLAGATWEQSISTEMQAAATICDTKGRDLRAQLERLESELRSLKAKQ